MDNKEFRKKIRKCKNIEEIQDLIDSLNREGYFYVKRWGYWELALASEIYTFKDNSRIHIPLPPAWSCSFKDIKTFSYNVRIKEEKN